MATAAAGAGAALSGPPPPLLGFGTYNKLRDHEGMAAGVRCGARATADTAGAARR